MTTLAANDAMRAGVPLFVDLDGTLVRTDLLYESFLDRLKRDWLLPARAVAWLMGGTAYLKTRLAQGHVLCVDKLPYNEAVLERIRAARASGRGVYLATASHLILAQQVADHLRLFDGVIATEQGRNVSGRGKLDRLRDQAGSDRYEYLGNSAADIPIWDAAMHAGVAAPDAAARAWLGRNAHKAHAVGEHATAKAAWLARLRLLRPHQWLENLLLGLPLVAAQQVFEPQSLLHVALGFVAFSLSASAACVIDDLLDLDSDRAHPRRRHRPFASGALPLSFGFTIVPFLLVAAFCVGALVSWPFNALLAACLLVTCACSLSVERTMAIDVLAPVLLGTLRVAAGAVAIQVVPSLWLLGVCSVLLFGLAVVRRGSE